MNRIEELKNKIKKLESDIELEKSFNSNSEELSFMYYQLIELKERLEALELLNK